MKKTLFVAIFITGAVASADIRETLENLKSKINATAPADCNSVLSSSLQTLLDLQENPELKSQSKTQGDALLQSLFELRASLRLKLMEYPSVCVHPIKKSITASRSLGDLVGVYARNIKQVKGESLVFQKQAVPLKTDFATYKTLGEKFPQFQSGDLMITKGVSFVSSTISQISQPASVFSHIVFVHRDEKNTQTIESYIGDGVKTYEMDFALKNENARILLLRSKNKETAEKADRYIYKRVTSEKIAYDYKLDFNDNKKLSCEEIAYDAYRYASQGQIKIPQFPARISLRDASFGESMGLQNGDLMAPADMEVDPRFEVVSDWTDLRLVRDSWRKDMVMSEMFRWMNQLQYNFVNDLSYLGIKLFLGVRLIPMFGDLVSKWLSVATDAPNSALISLDRIRTLGSILLLEIEKQDNQHFQKTGLWMSQRQLQQALENFRKKDRQNYIDPHASSVIHQYFRENNLVVENDVSF